MSISTRGGRGTIGTHRDEWWNGMCVKGGYVKGYVCQGCVGGGGYVIGDVWWNGVSRCRTYLVYVLYTPCIHTLHTLYSYTVPPPNVSGIGSGVALMQYPNAAAAVAPGGPIELK